MVRQAVKFKFTDVSEDYYHRLQGQTMSTKQMVAIRVKIKSVRSPETFISFYKVTERNTPVDTCFAQTISNEKSLE
jgi:hypothetical protein